MNKGFRQDEADLITNFVSRHASFNQDAGIFSAQQLNVVKSKIYELARRQDKIAAVIPRSTDTPEWADTVSYKMLDNVGMAKVVSNYSDDIPRADVEGKEVTVKVHTIALGYGYGWNELQISQALGTNLPARKGAATRSGIERKLDDIAVFGEAKYGLQGLLTHPNIGATTLSGQNWTAAATTAETIYADMVVMIDAISIQSNSYHRATHLLMSTVYRRAASSKFMANSKESAWSQFAKDFPDVTIVDDVRLATASSTGGQRLMAGEFLADNIELEVPMLFNQLPAEARNLEIVVPCLARVGGVALRYPLAFTKG